MAVAGVEPPRGRLELVAGTPQPVPRGVLGDVERLRDIAHRHAIEIVQDEDGTPAFLDVLNEPADQPSRLRLRVQLLHVEPGIRDVHGLVVLGEQLSSVPGELPMPQRDPGGDRREPRIQGAAGLVVWKAPVDDEEDLVGDVLKVA
ncbi:hypothetical protein WME98_20420 [Sorangium sp. So ce296]